MSFTDLLNELKTIASRLQGVNVKNTASTDAVSVDTSPTKLLDADDNRGTFILTHESSNTLYVGFTDSVSDSGNDRGHPVVANQPFGVDQYSGEVWAVAGSGSVNVTVTETV